MNLKLACADFTFPLLPHEQSLDLIAMLDFNGVDIGLFENRGHLWPSRELKNVAKSARALKKKLDDRGLKLADMFLIPATDFATLAPNHPDAAARRKARAQFERLVEYTARCGGRHVSALPGIHWKGESRETSVARGSEELAWRVARAKEAGITFSVECHLGSFAEKPAQAQELLARTPGLTLTLDYGHFTWQGIPDRDIEPLVAHASHFHARCGRKQRLQSKFTDNTIDFPRVLRAMKRTGYKGYIGVEYVWIDWNHCNEVDNLSETILLRDHLRSVKL